jgi:hypothetical protein
MATFRNMASRLLPSFTFAEAARELGVKENALLWGSLLGFLTILPGLLVPAPARPSAFVILTASFVWSNFTPGRRAYYARLWTELLGAAAFWAQTPIIGHGVDNWTLGSALGFCLISGLIACIRALSADTRRKNPLGAAIGLIFVVQGAVALWAYIAYAVGHMSTFAIGLANLAVFVLMRSAIAWAYDNVA